jgi:hypothetical protein
MAFQGRKTKMLSKSEKLRGIFAGLISMQINAKRTSLILVQLDLGWSLFLLN